MLIAVTSDAHGAQRQMDALLRELPVVDAFCFLGDMEKDAEYLCYGLEEVHPAASFYTVAGNNDPFSRLPRSIELTFGGAKTLITHGHLFRSIRASRATLARGAKADGCALALYGHTHVQCDETLEGVRLINPGALMRGEWALIDIAHQRVEVTFRLVQP